MEYTNGRKGLTPHEISSPRVVAVLRTLAKIKHATANEICVLHNYRHITNIQHDLRTHEAKGYATKERIKGRVYRYSITAEGRAAARRAGVCGLKMSDRF